MDFEGHLGKSRKRFFSVFVVGLSDHVEFCHSHFPIVSAFNFLHLAFQDGFTIDSTPAAGNIGDKKVLSFVDATIIISNCF